MDTKIIIGGTGLLGPFLVRELESLGHEVICLNRRGIHPTGGKALKVNRESKCELNQAFSKVGQFSLIDMIPYTAADAGSLLQALDGAQPRLTAVSSIDVYAAYNVLHKAVSFDQKQHVPLRESDKMRDRLCFQGVAYDKLNVEKIVWSYFNECSILRMPAIYGLPDKDRISRYAIPILNDEKIVLNPRFAAWRFSRSLNANCAYAIALATSHPGRDVFNVAERVSYSEIEWCQRIAAIANRPANIILDDSAAIPSNIETDQDWIVCSEKIRQKLTYIERYETEAGIEQVLQALA